MEQGKAKDKAQEKPALPRRWRKHVFALIDATRVQIFQLSVSLLFVLVSEFILQRASRTNISLQTELGAAVVLCGIWTTLHLVRDLRAARKEETEKTPLSRRRALLSKLTAPVRWLVAGVSGFLTTTLSVMTLLSLVVQEPWLGWLIASYYAFLLAWIGVEVLDWLNDQYILEEDRIVDITRIPVIYEQRTVAPLAMVQNATMSQSGWGVAFDYGNVIVETAGASRPIMFETVWRPKKIQRAIFDQIDALARKKQKQQRDEQAMQTQRWFEAYHTLTGGIRDVEYENVAVIGRPLRLKWRIQGQPGRHYRTWLVWDLVSREHNESYAYMTRPDGRPWYMHETEFDGIGTGSHTMRGWLPPDEARVIHFRVVVWFAGERATYSSPEMIIALGPGPQAPVAA